MTENIKTLGTTTISLDVLTSIVKLTTLAVPGVAQIATVTVPVDRLFTKNSSEGVIVNIEDSLVNVSVYVIAKSDYNLRTVGRDIQSHIARAISESIGMEPGKINVHFENIDYSKNESQ